MCAMSGTTGDARSPLPLPRYAIVVPRNAPDTLEYLTESLRGVPGIEVVLDRRTAREQPAPPLIERRTDSGAAHNGEAFGCRLVRVTIPAPAPLRAPRPPEPSNGSTVAPAPHAG
jgi:hypothetical protein